MRFIDKIRHSPWYFSLALLKNSSLRNTRRKCLSVYDSLGVRGKLAFDIGASLGGRTELMLSLGCVVIALEPDPSAFEVLTWRFGHHRRAVLLPKGAGNKVEAKALYRCTTSTLSTFSPEDRDRCLEDSRFSQGQPAYESAGQIEVTTLDSLIGEFGLPYFCKISTIGYEKFILAGLHHPIPVLSFTINLPYQIQAGVECCAQIASLGHYAFNLIFSDLAYGFYQQHWITDASISEQLRCLAETRPGNSSYVEVYCVEKSLFDQLPLAQNR